MYSFILQLSIISVLGLIAQSAPTDLTKRSTMTGCTNNKTSVLETRLCYAARDLHNADGCLRSKDHKYLSNLSKIENNFAETTKKSAKNIYDHFSYRCQNFTQAMTLKHRLQYHLFNANTASFLIQNAEDLSKILTSLQTMANTFDDIEFKEVNIRCVKLTPAQYTITIPPLDDSLQLINDLTGWYLAFNQMVLKNKLLA